MTTDAAQAEGTSVPAETSPAVEEATTQPQGETVDNVEEAHEAETTEEAASGEDSTDKEQKRKNSVQERINELTRQRREAEQRAQEAEERAQRLLAQYEQQENKKPPSLEDFGYDQDAYQQALAEYFLQQNQRVVQQGIAAQHSEEAKIARERAESMVRESFMARASDFAAERPDYAQKISNPQFVQTPEIHQGIMQADNGPELAYHLASNLELNARINSMPTHMALMELGRLSAQLSAPKPVKTSSAPPPVEPVTPKGKVDKSPEEMTTKEYHQWRLKRRGFN